MMTNKPMLWLPFLTFYARSCQNLGHMFISIYIHIYVYIYIYIDNIYYIYIIYVVAKTLLTISRESEHTLLSDRLVLLVGRLGGSRRILVLRERTRRFSTLKRRETHIYIYMSKVLAWSCLKSLKAAVTAWAFSSTYFTFDFSMCYVFVCLPHYVLL